MNVDDDVYEARYGWTRRSVGLVVVAALIVTFVVVGDVALWGKVVFGAFFGGSALVILTETLRLRGQVALRVDARGVTFGAPMGRQASGLVVPWRDIEAVAVFTAGRLRHIGLQRREDAATLPGSPGRWTRRVNRAMIPDVPGGIVDTSRPISGWRLDGERLRAAVAAHAPAVPVIDLAG